MSRTFNISLVVASSLILVSLCLASSCKTDSPAPAPTNPSAAPTSSTVPFVAPYLPPAYYQCTALYPIDLENAFFLEYNNTDQADSEYDGHVFVFKDLLVDTYMIEDVDQGWLWADLIKCPITNIEEAKALKPGDYVDIVGTLVGRDPDRANGLIMQDCYVLPAGTVQLPAPGESTTFAPSY